MSIRTPEPRADRSPTRSRSLAVLAAALLALAVCLVLLSLTGASWLGIPAMLLFLVVLVMRTVVVEGARRFGISLVLILGVVALAAIVTLITR